jgi:hypothetical protein
MIYWCKRSQHFGVTRLVSHVAYFAREVGVVGFLDRGVDVVLGGRDDGYVCAVFEEGEGSAIPDTRSWLDVINGIWIHLSWVGYPEEPPTTMTFLPASLSFEFTILTLYLTRLRDL